MELPRNQNASLRNPVFYHGFQYYIDMKKPNVIIGRIRARGSGQENEILTNVRRFARVELIQIISNRSISRVA